MVESNSNASKQEAIAAATAQGEVVKKLKTEDPSNKEAIAAAVAELKRLKALVPGEAAPVDYAKKYNQANCKDLLQRKFFYTPSFEIYGGCAGFYDYGPLGCAVKQNIEQLWRNHFVLEEDMLEVGCTNIMLEDVLKVSGHVGKFSDIMIKDTKTGTPHRADKLIQEHINKVMPKKKKAEEKQELEAIYDACEAYDEAEIDACVEKLKIKDPVTNNALTKAERFNLMFGVDIGPTGHLHGYLRPETAQGIFINFRRLLEYNNGKMPFASAQIGMGFRNEIHPKQGLLRTREFTMGEIEHFYDPEKTDHPKFAEVAHVKFPLWTAAVQEKDSKELITNLTIGEAVQQKIVKNETLAYFMTRTYLFLVACGIKVEAIRFRQHKGKEMAHYANDCWDAEVECSYEWVEVAGHSDRSAFDLNKHQATSKVEMCAARPLKEPIQVTNVIATLDKKIVGKEFKKDQTLVVQFFEDADEQQKASLMSKFEEDKTITINSGDKEFVLTDKHVSFKTETKTVREEKYTPWVIEPSYGIGRIVYCVFEHAFKERPAELQKENSSQRHYFDFSPLVAPLKCVVLPLINHAGLNAKTAELKKALVRAGVSSKVDDTGVSVGKRYARTDECGIPFAITIDFTTLEDNTVTVRILDEMTQVRMPMAEVTNIINQLSTNQSTWKDLVEKYGLFDASLVSEEVPQDKENSNEGGEKEDSCSDLFESSEESKQE